MTVYIGMERKILTINPKQKVCTLKIWHQKETRCWFMFYGYLSRLAYWFYCCWSMCTFINGGNCGAVGWKVWRLSQSDLRQVVTACEKELQWNSHLKQASYSSCYPVSSKYQAQSNLQKKQLVIPHTSSSSSSSWSVYTLHTLVGGAGHAGLCK